MQFSETQSALRNSLSQPHDWIIFLLETQSASLVSILLFSHKEDIEKTFGEKIIFISSRRGIDFPRSDWLTHARVNLHRLWKVSRRWAGSARPWKNALFLPRRERVGLCRVGWGESESDAPPSTRIKTVRHRAKCTSAFGKANKYKTWELHGRVFIKKVLKRE